MVRLGGTNQFDRQTIIVPIKEGIQHPNYIYPSHYNDIALFRLEKPVVYTDYIRPACLNSGEWRTLDDTIIATGWGRLGPNGDQSDTLMKVTLDSFTHSDCLDAYDPDITLRQSIDNLTQLCAGSYTTDRDTCMVSCFFTARGRIEKRDF